jgi:hypothetical protein
MTEPQSERARGWQPTGVSNDDRTFLGPVDVDDADVKSEFADVEVDTGEDHD